MTYPSHRIALLATVLSAAALAPAIGAAPAFASPPSSTTTAVDTPAADSIHGLQHKSLEWYSADKSQYGEFTITSRLVRNDRGAPSKLLVTIEVQKLQSQGRVWGWNDNKWDVTLSADTVVLRNGVNPVDQPKRNTVRHITDADGSLTALTIEQEFNLNSIPGKYAVTVTPTVLGGHWGGSATDNLRQDLYPPTQTLEFAAGQTMPEH